MQQGDYSSYYHQYPPSHLQNPSSNTIIPNPIPNLNPSSVPADLHQTSYASAPPYSGGYSLSDHPSYFQNYAPHPPQNPEPAPPSAPSYNPPPNNPTTTGVNPNSHSYPPYDSHAGSYQQTAFYQSYDHNQTAPPSFNQNQSYTSYSSAPSYNPPASSVPPASYDNSYENLLKFDQGSAYSDEKYSGFGRSRSNVGPDPYGMQSDVRGHPRFNDGYGDGVYAYEGGKSEPYGARGTAPKSSNSTLFDDYGRPLNLPSSGGGSAVSSGSSKVARAVPVVDEQADAKGGVQKFRVTIFCESGGPNTRDVLCQVGLDGIRILDPSTSRTLKIYPLENVTRCEVYDSSTIAFWTKSPVDIEPRRIKLQSNRYTNNTLLDTITAAIIQFKEMGESRRPQDLIKSTEQNSEKKKGFGDWINRIKPVNVEKDHWVPDEAVSKCTGCGGDFSAFNRRHHCRNCGDIFCDKCTQGRTVLTAEENAPQVRVCDRCLAEVTHRLNIAKEAANRPVVSLQSHEDLARKLKEEMEKNRRSSSGSRSDSSGRRMKEVACPTCTVHLQVQVPISGSETIECGVCQNPFRVSAN